MHVGDAKARTRRGAGEVGEGVGFYIHFEEESHGFADRLDKESELFEVIFFSLPKSYFSHFQA